MGGVTLSDPSVQVGFELHIIPYTQRVANHHLIILFAISVTREVS